MVPHSKRFILLIFEAIEGDNDQLLIRLIGFEIYLSIRGMQLFLLR